MSKLVNRARMTTATTGTGTITLGSAVAGFQTFAAAGVANADVVRYVIEDGSAWEIGTGTYTSAGTTMSRTLISSSTGSLLTLSGSAQVYVAATAEDFNIMTAASGSASAPSHSFDAATNTGMFLSGASLGFSVSGNTRMTIDPNGQFDLSSAVAFYPIMTFSNSTNDANAGIFRGAKARAGATVQASDYLFSVVGQGYNGTSFFDAAAMYFITDGTPTGSGVAGRVTFATRDASGSYQNRISITKDGDVNMLALSAEPSAPPASTGTLYSRSIANRIMPKFLGTGGDYDYPLQPHIGFNGVAKWVPGATTNTATFLAVTGVMPYTASATITTPAPASTSLKNQTWRQTLTSAATAGALVYVRANDLRFWRGSATGLGGFFYHQRFALTTLATGMRMFVGMQDSVANATNVDPTTSTTIGKVGLAINASTGNWNLVNNVAASAPTVTGLGASFPVNTTDVMELVLFCPPNGSTIGYRVTNWTTGAQTSGSLTTNIPAATTFLAPYIWATNNATAAAVAFDFISTYIETDY